MKLIYKPRFNPPLTQYAFTHFSLYTWANGEQEYSYLDNDLVTSTWLASHNLAINEFIACFICLPCGQAYTSSNVASHLSKSHKVRTTPAFKAKLNTVIMARNIVDVFPEIPLTIKPAYYEFAGITLVKEFGCPKCPLAGSLAYIKRHISDTHGKGGLPVPDIYTQVLNKAVTKSKIRIYPPTKDAPLDPEVPFENWTLQFVEAHQSLLESARLVPNARHISPWLLRTSWHELIQGAEVKALCDLVSLPGKDDEDSWVHSLVLGYLMSASDLIKSTGIPTLQRINSSDPDHT